jgi:uncharacterized protein YcfL
VTPPRLLVAVGLMLAAGCSALTPYTTNPAAPPKGVVDARDRVGVCFNKFKTTAEQVQQQAQAECAKNTVAELIDIDYRLDFCPMSVPGRASFACTPAK